MNKLEQAIKAMPSDQIERLMRIACDLQINKAKSDLARSIFAKKLGRTISEEEFRSTVARISLDLVNESMRRD